MLEVLLFIVMCVAFCVWLRLRPLTVRSLALGKPSKHFVISPVSRRARTSPKLPWEQEWVIAHYRLRVCGYGKTAELFMQKFAHLGHTMSASTVRNIVKHVQARADAAQRRCHHKLPRQPPTNRRWCIDLTGKHDLTRQEHTILGVMDEGSRACLCLRRITAASSEAILRALHKLIATFGAPVCIRTDNGSQFTSTEFKRAMQILGIKHELTAIASPWQNRIERMFLTLKEKLDVVKPLNGKALDALLSLWRIWYNFARPHQHLFGLTPAQVWQGIDSLLIAPSRITKFEAWGGLLTGYITERGRC